MTEYNSFIRGTLQSSKYREPEKTRKAILELLDQYRGLKPSSDSEFKDGGTSKKLLVLKGTIPIVYKSATFHIPIIVWLLDTFPLNAPMVFVSPTPDMRIKVSQHVDDNGKVYLPYLHDWKHNTSDLLCLVKVMIMTFSEAPPVYSVSVPPSNNEKTLRMGCQKDQTLLLEDFGRLMREADDLFADLTILTDNNKTLKAHKGILAARSKVFAATLANQDSIEIKAFDQDAVKGMLEYVYTGQVANLNDHARSLIQIAEKYDLQGLKVMAEDCIVNSLSVDNVAESLAVADLANATALKSTAKEFIIRNKEEVVKTDAFQLHVKSNPDLTCLWNSFSI